jgi:hypothetical protein
MATNPRIVGIKAKIERAKEHVDNLKAEVNAFLESEAYAVVVEDEQQTGDRVFRVRIKTDIPIRLAVIAGDVVHNLRATLDYLSWQLVEANGGIPDQRTEFPFGVDQADFTTRCQRKVRGVSAEAMSLIQALKPYGAGNQNSLYFLHRLDIRDKHRLLIMVGGIRDRIIHGPEALEIVEVRRGGLDGPIVPLGFTPEWVAFHYAAAHSGFPLKDGAEIHRIESRFRNRPKVDMDPTFTFNVAFGESGIFEGEPLVESLQKLADMIDGLIDVFFEHLPELK